MKTPKIQRPWRKLYWLMYQQDLGDGYDWPVLDAAFPSLRKALRSITRLRAKWPGRYYVVRVEHPLGRPTHPRWNRPYKAKRKERAR